MFLLMKSRSSSTSYLTDAPSLTHLGPVPRERQLFNVPSVVPSISAACLVAMSFFTAVDFCWVAGELIGTAPPARRGLSADVMELTCDDMLGRQAALKEQLTPIKQRKVIGTMFGFLSN